MQGKCVCRYFSSNLPEILPFSTVKRFRVDQNEPVKPSKTQTSPEKPVTSSDYRENAFKIQMLSRNLFQQIFQHEPLPLAPDQVSRFQLDLSRHGLKIETSPRFDDVEIKLPPLQGSIEEHFHHIAEEQSQTYRNLVKSLLVETPAMPKEFILAPGWTKYDENGPRMIDYPDEDALVFDVEVSVKSGGNPVMACAVGKYWYSWTAASLINQTSCSKDHRYTPEEFIPLEGGNTDKEKQRIFIGHNVSYDRARVKEQYELNQSNSRFLDTMSMHVAVSGVTSYQRAMLKSNKEHDLNDMSWISQTSVNSLQGVYKLYCDKELSKEPRDIFVNGTLEDVLENFQDLIFYCASDVKATREVLTELFPLFLTRFPHPATLAGMLEIGQAYLPVNSNWTRYLNESNLTYEELDIESKHLLAKRAMNIVKLMEGEAYKRDLWMWDQDWSTQSFKPKLTKIKKMKETTESLPEVVEDDNEESRLETKFKNVLSTSLPARRPLLAGYPAWYRKLCSKPTEEDWTPDPNQISTGMQVTPKLLNLSWEGYPLHYIKGHGWGFLVPFADCHPEDVVQGSIPIKELVAKCPVVDIKSGKVVPEMGALWQDVEKKLSKKDYYERVKTDQTGGRYKGTGVFTDLTLEGCCWFFKLPHKDGPNMKVGNPLAKDFINKFSENVLSGDGMEAERIIEIARMNSYWRNNKDRIEGQMVVWHDEDFGAIVPQLVVCGTLTRRAMEPTWLTASNAKEQRVGSELRALVQSPPGYRIVGADVDSQELWIASVLGDTTLTHGATPLGWMTLSGTKTDGSDMHSVTAKVIGINRDQAKVINYARIYGAGQLFAVQLLKQFNPSISDSEAKSKAHKMFLLTKGRKLYWLLPEFREEFEHRGYTFRDAQRLAALYGKVVQEMFEKPRWEGGTESAMFNRLEEIASEDEPRTPFLAGRLSRALEPQLGMEDRFLPTRVNWVVQSGAVDFLHLMLVCMRWLMQDKIRFCISFHDEVRYLVRDEDCYKAALAMHITNLLTRSFCVAKLGLKDLPQSVAFFSSVEIDTVLRKEATADCKTPSNNHGLLKGYGIPAGETLDIKAAIEKAGGNDVSQWEWHRK